MPFLLAIPKSLVILKEFLYTSLLLLLTEFLRIRSAQYRAPTDPSRVRGFTYRCEGLGSERQLQYEKYRAGTGRKFVFPMYSGIHLIGILIKGIS